jgi:hypothetical protein
MTDKVRRPYYKEREYVDFEGVEHEEFEDVLDDIQEVNKKLRELTDGKLDLNIQLSTYQKRYNIPVHKIRQTTLPSYYPVHGVSIKKWDRDRDVEDPVKIRASYVEGECVNVAPLITKKGRQRYPPQNNDEEGEEVDS